MLEYILCCGVSSWCNGYRNGLRNRSKRVHTPVALLRPLSGKYPWERYERPYPPSYGLNSTTTVGVSSWCNGYSNGLRNRSKRVHTPVALLRPLSGKYPWERYERPYPPSYGLNSTTTVGVSSWCNGYSDGLRNRSKRVHTPVALLRPLSGKYPWERYERPYPPSYGLNSTTTVGVSSWCNGYSDGLRNRSKRVHTPVGLLRPLSGKYPWERYERPYPPSYGLNSTTTVGVSSWCNGYSDGLRNRSKRVHTPVALLRPLSGKYPGERYEPPYPSSYGLNSTPTVLLGE